MSADDKAQARRGVLGSLPRRDAAFIRRVLIHQMLYGGRFAKVERLPEHLIARPASNTTIKALMQRLAEQRLGVSDRTLRDDVTRVFAGSTKRRRRAQRSMGMA